VIKNTRQPFYRDQINKVANAIDELIRGMKNPSKTSSPEKQAASLPPIHTVEPKQSKIQRKENVAPSKGKLVVAGAILLLALFSFFGFRWYTNNQKVDYARLVLIPAIEKLVEENFRPPIEAFDKAVEARQYIPEDSSLLKLWPVVSSRTPITTVPPGVEVFWKDYSKPEGPWRSAGVTPIAEAAFPRSYLRMEFRKAGFQTIEYAGPLVYARIGGDIDTLRLDSAGTLPDNMVRFPRKTTDMIIVGLESYGPKKVPAFLMDRFEVSNEQYKAFVDAGGYSDQRYWQHPFFEDGRKLSFAEAMKSLLIKLEGKVLPHGKVELMLKEREIIRSLVFPGMKRRRMLSGQRRNFPLFFIGVLLPKLRALNSLYHSVILMRKELQKLEAHWVSPHLVFMTSLEMLENGARMNPLQELTLSWVADGMTKHMPSTIPIRSLQWIEEQPTDFGVSGNYLKAAR
jgi:hypothetical protein